MGRTGAGKSSLVLALLRFYDFLGSILIDNVDTKSAFNSALLPTHSTSAATRLSISVFRFLPYSCSL